MAKSSTSFKPGVSGNPSGRPPLSEKERRANEILQAATPHAAATIAKAAMGGDVRAAMAVLERVLGKPRSSDEDLSAARSANPLAGLTPEQVLAIARGEKP